MFTTKEWESTLSFQAAGLSGEIRLIDPMDGSIYQIPENMVRQKYGFIHFVNIPIKDYPLILTFGEFI